METAIPIPNGVTASLQGNVLTVKGPKGELQRAFASSQLELAVGGNAVVVRPRAGAQTVRRRKDREIVRKKTHALAGTWAAHIRNLFMGAQTGFEARLRIIFSHFPIKVTAEKGAVTIGNFLGERAPRSARIVADTAVQVDKDTVIVSGPSIEDVGRTAANIEAATKVRRFDRRVFQDGIHLIQKCRPLEA